MLIAHCFLFVSSDVHQFISSLNRAYSSLSEKDVLL